MELIKWSFCIPYFVLPPKKKINEIVFKIIIINLILYNFKKKIRTQMGHLSQRALLKEVTFKEKFILKMLSILKMMKT